MENKPQPQPITELITELLASKKITERETTNSSGCNSCYFNNSCKVNKRMPCMGHNRQDRKSIYYVGVK